MMISRFAQNVVLDKYIKQVPSNYLKKNRSTMT